MRLFDVTLRPHRFDVSDYIPFMVLLAVSVPSRKAHNISPISHPQKRPDKPACVDNLLMITRLCLATLRQILEWHEDQLRRLHLARHKPSQLVRAI